MGNRPVRRVQTVLILAAFASSAVFALKIPERSSRFDALAIPDPSVVVSPDIVPADAARMHGLAKILEHPVA